LAVAKENCKIHMQERINKVEYWFEDCFLIILTIEHV